MTRMILFRVAEKTTIELLILRLDDLLSKMLPHID